MKCGQCNDDAMSDKMKHPLCEEHFSELCKDFEFWESYDFRS